MDYIDRLLKYSNVDEWNESTAVVFGKQENTSDNHVATVCSCPNVKDEKIQMHIVQRLAADTCTRTCLYYNTLLTATRTMYSVYQSAQDQSTQFTANLFLTQIENFLFLHMVQKLKEVDLVNLRCLSFIVSYRSWPTLQRAR